MPRKRRGPSLGQKRDMDYQAVGLGVEVKAIMDEPPMGSELMAKRIREALRSYEQGIREINRRKGIQ